VHVFGYRYVMPVRFTYDARAPGDGPDAYSFASLDRSTTPHGWSRASTAGRRRARLVRYEVDPVTSLLRADEDGTSQPHGAPDDGVPGMQGAASWTALVLTTSRGRFRLGTCGSAARAGSSSGGTSCPSAPDGHHLLAPARPARSLSEYPHARFVFAMPRRRLLR
jgi:hypothetical protein